MGWDQIGWDERMGWDLQDGVGWVEVVELDGIYGLGWDVWDGVRWTQGVGQDQLGCDERIG